MHRRKRRRLRTEGNACRCMWKSHRSSDIGGKSLKTWILLAHNAQRRDITSQEVQSLSRARQNLSPPIRAADFSHKPLAFSVVGARHIGTSAHWKGLMQIRRRSSGLLHQMGRSRALGYHHRKKKNATLFSAP